MRLACAFLAIGLCLASCQPSPEPQPPPPLPTLDRIRADLEGVTFDFYSDADGPRDWTIEADEVTSLALVDSARRDQGARIRARVTLAAQLRTIRGLLDLDYRRDSTDWHLVRVERAGGNFAVGDVGFILYDVGVVPSDSLHPDRLSLDVIVRFDGGAWTTPLDGLNQRVRSAADSTLSDSLQIAAIEALADEVRATWVPTGREVRVWAPGRRARTVAIDSAQVGVDGCQYVVGWARGQADANALGSTSSALGGTAVRALTSRETRALGRLAAQRLDVQGQNSARLRSTGSLAADLDGDGSDELVGAFSVGADTVSTAAGIVVAARMASDGARLLFERIPDYAKGRNGFSLIGVTDLDADGADEIILREEGYEVFSYRILAFRAGRYVDAFRGGGGGC